LRKRNKSIVAFSLGVLVSQTSNTGGAMNAYRFAIEQKKAIATFQDDGTDDTRGNRDIASAEKVKAKVFRFGGGSGEEYVSWLRGLSSSI
jgi:predicted Rossmann fold nucleotide-binding protein DprA/Smf involved in DNA uptake